MALPYWEDMPRLLHAASAIVARPGSATTSEAVLCGCPLILNGLGGLMPQERLTVRFACRHGIARLIRRPGDLGRILDEGPEALAEMGHNMAVVRPAGYPREILATAGGRVLDAVAGPVAGEAAWTSSRG